MLLSDTSATRKPQKQNQKTKGKTIMKKFLALLLALVMVMGLATTAFAQEVNAGSGNGTITIKNPSKGESYGYVKLFDATVDTKNNSIAYTGNIPSSLASVFEKDSAGNISVKAGVSDDAVVTAVQAWAKTQTVQKETVSDGSELTFKGLEYGYYAVISTQGAVVTIDSTNPHADIYDKNSSEVSKPTKEVDDDNVKIGDTATFTVKWTTANYDEKGKIVSYTINDTLPAFLENVTVTSITVDGTAIATQPFANKEITIPWVNGEGEHLYKNGVQIVITYTAVVTEEAAIAGNGNTNKVTLKWTYDDGTPGGGDKYTDEETIYTYALALKKVNDKGVALAGATFQFPFYVKANPDTDGAYIYAGTTAGNGLINQITTPASGIIIVKGLESGVEVSITEITAPDGYNKLTTPVVITPVKTSATTTSTTVYLDENGNVTDTQTGTPVTIVLEDIAATTIVVVNKAGAELPSTGGMGTTMFYIFGFTMMMAAVVLLVTKKRMADAV